MIAPPFSILILSTYLERDLIYTHFKMYLLKVEVVHIFLKCAKLAQSPLSPNSSLNGVTVDS